MKTEVNYGKTRRNDWKWKQEVEDDLIFYQNKFCECGCGNKLNPSRKQVRDSRSKKKSLRVLRGHHNNLPEAKAWLKAGKDHPMYGKKGKLSPVWKGGGKNRTDYGFGWEAMRRKTLKRDNNTCQKCFFTKAERRIDVHHKIPFKTFTDHVKANHLENLISLCYKCHQIEEWKLRNKDKQDELLESPERVISSQVERLRKALGRFRGQN